MYLEFYRLKRNPFHVTPDPEFLYLSPSHREALASIVYGVDQRKGIIEITGEVGTGKTTILRSYLSQIDPKRVKTAYVFNPDVTFPVLMKNIFQELGIEANSEEAHAMVAQFHQYLIEEYKKDNTVILFIDEAQNAPVKTLESMRLLSNLETPKEKLLQIVLCGQPELEAHLNRTELRQLKQRIAVRALIRPLSDKESLEYIRHRLGKALNGKPDIFAPAALARIVRKAKGNPRVINILCDNALVTGYGYQERRIGKGIAREIIADLDGTRYAKYGTWAVAGVSALLLLAGGAWTYTKIADRPAVANVESSAPADPVVGQKIRQHAQDAPRAERTATGESVETIAKNPSLVRIEIPGEPAAGRDNVPRDPGSVQAGADVPAETIADKQEEVQGNAQQEAVAVPQETGKPAVESRKRKEVPVARSRRNRNAQLPPPEEFIGISDQVVLKREKKQGTQTQGRDAASEDGSAVNQVPER